MILGLIVGVAWFATFFLGHLAMLRVTATEAGPSVNQRLFLLGLVGVIASPWFLVAPIDEPALAQGVWLLVACYGVLVYSGLFILYMPFYYAVVASLSVRTIVLLSEQPDRTLSIATLRSEFASRCLVDQRLTTMAMNGFLVIGPNGYVLTPKGRFIARFFAFVKVFWKLGTGG